MGGEKEIEKLVPRKIEAATSRGKGSQQLVIIISTNEQRSPDRGSVTGDKGQVGRSITTRGQRVEG